MSSHVHLVFIVATRSESRRSRASLSHQAGDVVILGGSLNGKSLDPMGIPLDIVSKFQNGAINYTKWLGRLGGNNAKPKGFYGSIQEHFEKIYTPKVGKPSLDKVVIDYKYFDSVSVVLGQPPDFLKQQIDQLITTNFPQYNNSDFVIKLNY